MNLHVRSAALASVAIVTPPPGDTRTLEQAIEHHRGAPPPKRGSRAASVVPSTYDAETHTVEVVLSSGADVRRWGYIERLLIDPAAIDLSRVATGAVKILDSHNAGSIRSILGGLQSTRFAGGNLLGVIKFGETAAALEAEGMVARGELTHVSIGYEVAVWRAVEVIADPTTGSEITIWRADEWALFEASWVSVPADPKAGVRSAVPSPGNTSGNSAGAHEEDDMHTRSSGADAPAPAAAAATAPAAAPAATRAAEPAPAPAAAAPATVTRFGATDALDFVSHGRSLGLETEARALVDQNTTGTISLETARSTLLRQAAERQSAATSHLHAGGSITITEDARDKWMRGAMNGILHRAGLADLIARAAKMRGETVDLNPGEFRGIRNVDLARMALENMGQRVSTYDHNQIIGMAFTATRAGQATGDFPILLENTLNKVLQAGYAVTPDTWTRFCGKGSLKDFRPHPRYLRGTFGALDSLTENGEFKNKPIPDGAKESITGKTKGNIVALTRQAIANDDMGAFSDIAVDLARAAKLTVEIDVFALLALNSGLGPNMNDGNPMFDAAHGNIASVGAAPSVTAFDAIGALMASQKDLSGNEILDIRPAIWIGPRTIWGSAATTNGAEYDPDTASKLMRPNIVKGMFSDVVGTPRLTGTRWYAFADPTIAPAIEVAFLDGIQEPFLEQKDGWRTDGTEWKVRLDYGVGAINAKSAATNAGA